jgi:formylglycine-generating enzyme required for sulfatase activity
VFLRRALVAKQGTDREQPPGATATGLLDVTGNVSEWVADWYSDQAYATHEPVDPTGPLRGSQRLQRGGAYLHGVIQTLRVRNRMPADPDQAASFVGFRCAVRPLAR